jgi:signal peptide peptidase SppA
MRVLDILNSPWAILPDRLDEIIEIYGTHLRGEKIDIAAVEVRMGKKLDNEREQYAVENGTAVIPVHGVIAKRANLFMEISGGTSTQLLAKDFQAALDDPDVHSIVLAIDSPGGTVDGTQEIADMVRDSRGKKPIVAHADGMMASAAYWIGSGADRIYIAGDTTAVGSIGVVARHVDYSEADKARGVKVTEITAGKYKRIASEHEPLSQDGRAYLQSHVDHLYSAFFDSAAKNRGWAATPESALAKADGKIFLGKQAVNAGLVDGVSTLPALVSRLNRERFDSRRRAVALAIQERL